MIYVVYFLIHALTCFNCELASTTAYAEENECAVAYVNFTPRCSKILSIPLLFSESSVLVFRMVPSKYYF